MEDEYETVLFVARECFVYKVPPRSSAAGYRAAEWGDMEVRALIRDDKDKRLTAMLRSPGFHLEGSTAHYFQRRKV